ncbi:putative methyltransferase [Marinithermofilum abyssi]|uniref:Uncharacterized methyltransferase GCM10011571_21950 n=1 Tax=Marinithermofilum abyssi TaxID=1571185 RepID=A0A8J2VI00_9BACL|nr:class I SAM-dependent methyltransferase [Marinithermofilum abyssi]GGE19622.1 putative methyltransferase [Marinithermofilum abyssi]
MGVEFNELFDQWAASYDAAVAGQHPEYREVFEKYTDILNRVVRTLSLPQGSRVLEIGVGTGNLTHRLIQAGYEVTGVEPSLEMRRQALQKLPRLNLYPGHFLDLPNGNYDGVVSTYAFHHLTDPEKETALEMLAERLGPKGRIIFADTMFRDDETKSARIQEAERRGMKELAADLRREYYPTLPVMKKITQKAGLKAEFIPLNRYVWLMEARKNLAE